MPPRDQILATLRQHAPELQAAGIAHLRLFGSVARGEATSTSDIDLLADFAPDAKIGLLTFCGIQERLSELLGATVDLSATSWLKKRVSEHALAECVDAF